MATVPPGPGVALWCGNPAWAPRPTAPHSPSAPALPLSPTGTPALRGSSLRSRTLQRPLDGVVEVQGGLSGEAGAEVDVADACDPHRVAAAADDLAGAHAHVTGPWTRHPGSGRANPARQSCPSKPSPTVTPASFVPSPRTGFCDPPQDTHAIPPSPQTPPNEPKPLRFLSPAQSRRPLLCL